MSHYRFSLQAIDRRTQWDFNYYGGYLAYLKACQRCGMKPWSRLEYSHQVRNVKWGLLAGPTDRPSIRIETGCPIYPVMKIEPDPTMYRHHLQDQEMLQDLTSPDMQAFEAAKELGGFIYSKYEGS